MIDAAVLFEARLLVGGGLADVVELVKGAELVNAVELVDATDMVDATELVLR